ncbi:MAG: tail fiber domain-containing protein [Candidatus Nanoarchaeia archaeon]
MINKIYLAVFALLLAGISVFASVNQDLPWHPIQQVALNDSTTDSVDSNEDGIIDYSENLESSTGTSNVNNLLRLNGNDINMNGQGYITFQNNDGNYHLGGGNTPDAANRGVHLETGSNPAGGSPIFVVESQGGSERLRVEHAGRTTTSNSFYASGGYSGTLNMNGHHITNLRRVYGVSGNNVVFEDTPQSTEGLHISSGVSYFDNRIRVDDIQERNSGDVSFLSPVDMNNNNIENADEIYADAFYYSSDEALKKDITTIDSALDKLSQINGVQFSWKESGQEGIGLLAQDVEKVFPEAVNDNGHKSVQYANLISPAIQAIKELKEKNEKLEEKLETQDKKIDELEKRLERLEEK